MGSNGERPRFEDSVSDLVHLGGEVSYLPDGRAKSVDEAIRLHGGEGSCLETRMSDFQTPIAKGVGLPGHLVISVDRRTFRDVGRRKNGSTRTR